MSNPYNKRYVANIVIEALSPLKVGSSAIDMLQDAPVQKDWNTLPMILGTSIAGVLRKEFDSNFANDVFGDEDSNKKESKGSRLIISNALLCSDDMMVIESLGIKKEKRDFLDNYDNLPLRDHVKITHRGVADIEDKGKYDEEVVYAGSRFRFRVELIGDDNDDVKYRELLSVINSKIFRLGGGTTKGFGEIEVQHEHSSYEVFNIDSDAYRAKSSSLNVTFKDSFPTEKKSITHKVYTLTITPDDFFMFGSGFGDDEADMTPVKERVVKWSKEGKGYFDKEQILIPASSVKGALAHRTAFYYNKAMLATNKTHTEVGENNEAIKAIFGHKKESDEEGQELGQKGKILISDCFKTDKDESKIFDHVAIDRFTGGAIEGALFQEKTIAQKDEWEIEILVEKSLAETAYSQAFESALSDVCNGMLALGGATTKGHGIFNGTWSKS